jgi:chromosome segregation ATPase
MREADKEVIRADVAARVKAEVERERASLVEEVAELQRREAALRGERDSMVTQAHSSAEEGRRVTERVKALQKQIDEQQEQYRRSEQITASAVNKERMSLHAAERAAGDQHRRLESELASSRQEAEAVSYQLQKVNEERTAVSLQRRTYDEHSGPAALSSVEARASQEIRQLQEALATERGEYLASENKLGILAQSAKMDKVLTGHEYTAAASNLRARARLFETEMGSQAEATVHQAEQEAAVRIEDAKRAVQTGDSGHGGDRRAQGRISGRSLEPASGLGSCGRQRKRHSPVLGVQAASRAGVLRVQTPRL